MLTVAAGTLAAIASYRGNQVGAQLAAANAETLAAQSLGRAPTDIATAAQLAMAAWGLNPKSPQTRTALANAYLALRSLDAEILNPTGEPIKGVPGYGDTALLAPSHGLVVLTGVSGPAPQRWQIPDISPDAVGELSPDGRWFADVTKDGTIRLRDVLDEVRAPDRGDWSGPAALLMFSPDSKRIAWLTDSGRQGEVDLRSCDLTTCVTKPPGPRPLPAPRTIYGFWLTPDPNQVLVRYGDAVFDDSRVVLRSIVDGAELATMAPHAIVAQDGAAVVSCEPAPDTTAPFATATITVARIGDTAPPIRINAAGGACGGLGLSSDGGWLVEHISGGNLSHESLRLTDLGNGVRRHVTTPSGVDLGGGVSVVKTLGVSTAGGRPSVLFAQGTSLLRLRTEPAPNDQGNPPSRRLVDGGRDVSWSTPGMSWSSRGSLSVEERSTGRPIATLSDLDPFTNSALTGNSLWLVYPAGNRWQVDRYEVSPFRKITTFLLPAIHPDVRGFGAVSPIGKPTMFLVVSGGALVAVDSMNGSPPRPAGHLAPTRRVPAEHRWGRTHPPSGRCPARSRCQARGTSRSGMR